MSQEVVTGPVRCVGFEQLTGIGSAKVLQSIPPGVDTPTHAIFQADGAAVRFRGDPAGVDPTTAVGQKIGDGGAVVWDGTLGGSLENVKFIQITATAVVNVHYMQGAAP